jgi:hypothetical protein
MRGTMQLFAGTCLAILFLLLLNVHCMSASKAPAGQSHSFCKNKQLAKHLGGFFSMEKNPPSCFAVLEF